MARNIRSFVSANEQFDEEFFNDFKEKLEKSAVQSKTQESLFDQINAVINGARSKFSTVTAVVEDMKERSGLTAYLKTSKEINVENEVKKTASIKTAKPTKEETLEKLEEQASKLVKEKRWLDFGKVCGKIAKLIKDTNLKTNVVKVKVPKVFADDWAIGYCETIGEKLSDNEVKALKKKFAQDTNQAFDKKIPVESIKVVEPIVIKKVPSIKNTIENYINSTKGTLSISAIIEKIKAIHKSDVPDVNDWEDENLLKFITKLNLTAKKNNPNFYHNDLNLGKQDVLNDNEIDPSNYNAFYLLESK